MKKNQRGEMYRAKGEGVRLNVTLGLGLEKTSYLYLLFFLSADLVEPVRFGSAQSNSNFENRNFFVIFQSVNSVFFLFSFFSYFFFPVFFVYRFFYSPLNVKDHTHTRYHPHATFNVFCFFVVNGFFICIFKI
jgi:hypothetical protein